MSRATDKRISALRRFAVTISVFTIVGHIWLGFETPWAAPVVALLAAYSLEVGFEALDAWATRRRPRFQGGLMSLVNFLLPAHISALAISMLIYPGSRLWPFVFAVTVSTTSKYLLKAPVNGKLRHVLNPSNVGIAATLLIFPWVGIGMPYHFTENISGWLDWVIPFAILASGLLLNLKLTGKGPIVAGWVIGFIAQAVVRDLFTDISLVAALAPMSGLAFFLFTNYMITDPGTTPASPRNQFLFAFAAAGVYGVLMLLHIVFGIFFCVVIVCVARWAFLWVKHWLDAAHPARAQSMPIAEAPIQTSGVKQGVT